MANDTGTIQQVDEEKMCIQLDGHWRPLVGKAKEFVKYMKPGPAEIGWDKDNNGITFAKNIDANSPAPTPAASSTAPYTPPSSDRDDRITMQWAINASVQIHKLWAECGGGSEEHTKGMTHAQHAWQAKKELMDEIIITATSLHKLVKTTTNMGG